MDLTMIVLKVLHVFAAVFWAGTVFFLARFLVPAIRSTGPEGGRVALRLFGDMKVSLAIMGAAIVTILSGFVLYWKDSNGFSREWMTSKMGLVFGVGALFGIAAAAVGGAVSRRASAELVAIGKAVQAAGGTPTPDQAARIQSLQALLGSSARVVAALLAIALACMISARYVLM